MRTPTRASIYALVPPLVALLVGFGLVTDAQGLVLAGLATEAITLAIACYHAVKTRTPLARTVVYGFLAALSAAAVVWGLVDAVRAELIVAAVMALAGVFLAESNTSAVEVGADGIPDDNPQHVNNGGI